MSGGKILLRGYENGKKIKQAIPFAPYLFMPSNEPTEYKSIYGKYLSRIDFLNVWEAKKWLNEYKDVTGFSYAGMDKWQYVYIHDNYPKEIQYDVNLIRGLSWDIEVDTTDGYGDIALANKVITAISMGYRNQRIVLSYKDYTPKADNVKYIKCYDEVDLLQKFLHIWETIDPEYISGWNIFAFDIPYTVRRIINVLGEEHAKRLSPWKQLRTREVTLYGREQEVYEIVGVATLDYQDLYKRFTYNQRDSYSLNNIAHLELGDQKVDYSEYGTLHELYEKDFEKFIDYSLHDTELIFRLDNKMKLFELAFAMAYDAKVNYSDIFTSVHYWDILIYNYLADQNIIVPKYERRMNRPFEGGYVKEVKPALYNWVVSFDLNSLYPSLIEQINIGPETFVKKESNVNVDYFLKGNKNHHEYSMASNGCLYKKDKKSFFSKIIERQKQIRSLAKTKMIEFKKAKETCDDTAQKTCIDNEIAKYDNIQMAKKIQNNSLYGVISTETFRYFDVNNAEAITLSGQLSVQWAEKQVNVFLNTKFKKNKDWVLAIDTDSLYLDLEEIIRIIYNDISYSDEKVEFLDKFAEKILQPVINSAYNDLAENMNVYQNILSMKRESIGDKAVWLAKKRYMINVRDSEGVRFKEPDLKTMGIEVVRSSTPEVCRNNLKESIKIIMSSSVDELRTFIDKFKKNYKTLPFHEIAFPRGVNGLLKYSDSSSIYKLGTPIHVRGALLYNKMLKDRGIKTQPIYDGDKIKFCYLKMPNSLHENVIASTDIIPEDLEKFIDYEMMFEKSFLDPLNNILDAIGWSLEKKNSLGDLF